MTGTSWSQIEEGVGGKEGCQGEKRGQFPHRHTCGDGKHLRGFPHHEEGLSPNREVKDQGENR